MSRVAQYSHTEYYAYMFMMYSISRAKCTATISIKQTLIAIAAQNVFCRVILYQPHETKYYDSLARDHH